MRKKASGTGGTKNAKPIHKISDLAAKRMEEHVAHLSRAFPPHEVLRNQWVPNGRRGPAPSPVIRNDDRENG